MATVCLCLVSDQSSKGTLCVSKDPKRLQADSKDSDQPARMRRLIRVFARRTCDLMRNTVFRFMCDVRNILI